MKTPKKQPKIIISYHNYLADVVDPKDEKLQRKISSIGKALGYQLDLFGGISVTIKVTNNCP